MSNGPALRPSSPDHESSVAPVTTGADGLSPSSVTSISNHIQQKEVTLAASIADDGLAGGSNEDGARHPDVTAASTEANNGTHPRPKRRRLDAELAFSSPGPAFRIQLSGDDQHTGRNDDSPGGKDGRRASRSLRVRRSITQVNESLNNSSASNSDAKKGGAANGTVAQPAHTLSAGSEQSDGNRARSDTPSTLTALQSPSNSQAGPSASSNTSKATAPVNLDSADNASVNSANTVKRERSRSASPTAPSAPADDTLEDPSSLPLITAPPRTKPTITPITALTGDVPFPEILSKRRQEKVALAQSDLEEVHEDHDLLVRELFHLTKFVTMVGYDPEVARQDKSDVFTTFQQSHDLRFALDPTDGPSSSTSGRATRRSVNARLQSLSLKRALPPPPAPATPSSSSKTAQAMTNGKDSARKRTRRSSSLLDSDRSSVVAGKARARDANDDANSDEDGSATPSNGRRSSVVLRNGSIDAANSPQAAKPKRSGRKSKIMDNLDAFIERHRPRPLPDHPPPLRILAPHHVPQPSRFGGNLEAFWESFSLLHDDNITAEAASELERAELDAYLRVDQSRREGFLPNEGHAAENVRLSAHQMVRKKAHHDHLLEAVSSGYASMRQNTKHRQQLAKRVARMVAQHWDRQSGSSERERKAEEKRVRALARWTIKEVGKQWRLAVNVVRARKAAAEKAEKEKLDKAQLNAILEQSTQMLRKQQEEMARLDGHDDSGSERSLYDSDSDSIGASSKESQIELSDTPDEDEDASDEESLVAATSEYDSTSDGEQLPWKNFLLELLEDPAADDFREPSAGPEPVGNKQPEPRDERSVPVDTEPERKRADVSGATFHSRQSRRHPLRSGAGSSKVQIPEADLDDVEFETTVNGQADKDDDLERQMLAEDDEDDSEDAGLAADADVPIEELLKRYGYPAPGASQTDISQRPSATARSSRPRRRARSSSSTPSISTLDPDANDVDFSAESDQDGEDVDLDRQMLEDDQTDDNSSEDAGLAADASVPIEELLKRYGYQQQSTDAVEPAEVPQSPMNGLRATTPRRGTRRSLGTAKLEEPEPGNNDVEFSAADSDLNGEDEDLDRQMLEDEDEEDDASEDAGLAADADVPIEELLQRYGYNRQNDAATGEADGAEESEESDVYSMDDDESSEDDEDERSGKDDAMTSSETGLTLSLIKADSDADVESDAIEEQNERASSLAPSSSRETPDAALVDESDTESTATSSRRSHRRSTTRASSAVSSDRNQARSRQPFLLRGQLRPYQQIGFEWLAGLYANGVNGILADEMGLGKTIQTISLLAHLACDKGVWGPHLVVAPTSVMLNWEVEFKKFLPGFKILSYYGNQRERKEKRVGWNTENSFNVCITSYQLVLADQHIFRRKPWVYLVLDEAHHIKNFRSQRWQTLLGFNSQRRLLLTGTPLQNNLMDLWSLMYFLMPHGATELPGGGAFANMKDFQEWFSNPLNKAIEGGTSMDEETRAMVSKLHTVLRPFLLRRLKSEVEKELPSKYEHVITCRLSKRQRFLYNDFMSRAKTRESLASGNYLSIINCLMQLRKVCNHPDLFEVRPIVTSFAMQKSVIADYEIKDLLVRRRLLRHEHDLINKVDLSATNFVFTDREQHLTAIESRDLRRLNAATKLPHFREKVPALPELDTWTIDGFARTREQRSQIETMERWKHRAYVNQYRCTKRPVYGAGLISLLRQAGEPKRLLPLECHEPKRKGFLNRCDTLLRAIKSYPARQEAMQSTIDRFVFATPRAVAVDMPRWALAGFEPYQCPDIVQPQFDTLHPVAVKLHIAFPDASLLQYDCGKLQQLNILMRRLKEGGHRILIFTQMTRVLDILESFLNFHGYRYLRLDGQTKVEHRQALTEKFNRDLRISAFILSTRSGGLGINLTGADTVLFYDLDWNAAIEAQCMDRAHRIGQTRDVHIYRFVTEHTIEENMLKKANQKRLLDSVVIQEGEFNTDAMAKKIDWRDMLDDGGKLGDVEVEAAFDGSGGVAGAGARDVEKAFLDAEDEEDRQAALAARQEMFIDESDFSEQQQQQAQQGQQQKSADGSSRDQSSTPLPTDLTTTRTPGTGDGTPMLETPDDAVVEAEAEEEEEEGGTIDDYMLKFVEWDWDFFA